METRTVKIPTLRSDVKVVILSADDMDFLASVPEEDRARETLMRGLCDVEVVVAKLKSLVSNDIMTLLLEGRGCQIHAMAETVRSELLDAIHTVNALSGVRFGRSEVVDGHRITVTPDGQMKISPEPD